MGLMYPLNWIFGKRNKYKCVAYVNNKEQKDVIVDAFEINEFSLKKAYKVAYEVLQAKYPNAGLDIRIYRS